MFERRLFYHIDWPMIAALGALCAIGVAMIYATTHAGANAGLCVKQLYAIGIGVVAFAVCLTIDYRPLADNAARLLRRRSSRCSSASSCSGRGAAARAAGFRSRTSPCSPRSSPSCASR